LVEFKVIEKCFLKHGIEFVDKVEHTSKDCKTSLAQKVHLLN